MSTFATPNWYERDGKRHNMTGGRSGIAEAMETSPAKPEDPPEVIGWGGTITQLQVATGPHGGRFSVLRDAPLNVRMEGGAEAVLRSSEVGEKFSNGTANRQDPAVHRLVWTDFTLDVRYSNGAYPFVTNVNTRLGTFGVRRCNVLSSGAGHVVKTAIRGNASGRYVITKVKALNGLQEYVAYLNAGAGESVVEDVEGWNCGRGVMQGTLRSTENGFYTPEEDSGTSLLVSGITARDCGAAGSSAVSIAGWADSITVRDLYVDTIYNTAAISLRYDKKQAQLDKPWDPKKANVIGPGKMLSHGHAHGTVTLDLESSYIQTGTVVGGSQTPSSRPAIMVDSCQRLWVASSSETMVDAPGNLAMHVEHQGAGAIRTVDGTQIGTRAVDDLKMVGNYSDWGPMRRAGQPMTADEYLSRRGG